MSSSPSILRCVLSLVKLRHPRARERDGGLRFHVRSGDDRDRDRDRPKVTVGRTAESGVGAWVSLEAALTKNCHCHGNVKTVVACRLPDRCRHRESSRQGTEHPRPLSSAAVSRRGLALRCRIFFGVVLIQARVGIFLRKAYINGNRIDLGTLNAKHTGFALKCELSNKKMQKNSCSEKNAILCEKGAYYELASSVRPHPLKEGVPTALQDANRAAAVRLYSPPHVRGWSGFGETRSYAQVRRGIVLWWGVPRCRLHSGGRVRCREAVRLGVAHAEGCPLVFFSRRKAW